MINVECVLLSKFVTNSKLFVPLSFQRKLITADEFTRSDKND